MGSTWTQLGVLLPSLAMDITIPKKKAAQLKDCNQK
jgi:hypothetical protein